MKPDVIVLGVGGMGSAACYHLAKRGVRVLGLEQFQLGHDQGSSHGETRIIRKSYFEHPDYVPLMNRAYELWSDLERESGRKLYYSTGVVYFGKPTSPLMRGLRLSAERYGIPIEELSAAEALRRYPVFRGSEGDQAIFEPDAGYLRVEDCVKTHADLARKRGAEIRWGERVLHWRAENGQVEVRTDQGTYTAGKLVIAGGAWSSTLMRDLNLPLRVLRKTLFWFDAGDEFLANGLGKPAGMPCFLFDTENGFFYGFPKIDQRGVKVARHSGGTETASPTELDRVVNAQDQREVEGFLASHLPGVSDRSLHSTVCMYTMTPDENFIVDRHPEFASVSLAAGFSGHGFKFASLIGEVLADLAEKGKTAQPIEFLSIDRLRRD